MATHDYVIANQGFPAFRSDLNNALAAIVSNNSSATEPTTMFAHMIWVDTAADPSILKIRNADNDAWITIGSIDQTGDTFTMVNLKTSGPVVFNDAGADVDFRVEGDTDVNLLFVDASADSVGIGTSSPSYPLQVIKNQAATTNISVDNNAGNAASHASLILHTGGASSGDPFVYFYNEITDWSIGCDNSDSDKFKISKSSTLGTNDYFNIDASGNVLVATTSQINAGRLCIDFNQSTHQAIAMRNNNAGNGGNYVVFMNSADAQAGIISQTGATTINYGTSSDYRLKENVVPMTGALAKVLELNPVTYTWKVDGSAGEGFIAHELQAVCPDAVVGQKDATESRQVEVSPAVPATYDEEGNELTPAVEAVHEEREVPVIQSVDTSFLVATLTAAIQELSAKNDALEARIAALETGV